MRRPGYFPCLSRGNLFLATILFAAILAVPLIARAQHEGGAEINATQLYISHADATPSAAASPAVILNANSNRVTAICQMVGTIGTNTARLGDASIGPSQGTQLSAAIPAATFDVTGALYVYSATGATVNCAEIVRP